MTDSDTRGEKRRRLFLLLLISLVIALFWLSALLWLTLRYSNPITLNLDQIQQSDSILLGTFEGKEFLVSKAWGIDPDVESIRLRNLRLASIEPQAGLEYLVPVLINGEGFEITPSRVRGTPLIYPASDEVISNLEDMVSLQVDRSPTLQVPLD